MELVRVGRGRELWGLYVMVVRRVDSSLYGMTRSLCANALKRSWQLKGNAHWGVSPVHIVVFRETEATIQFDSQEKEVAGSLQRRLVELLAANPGIQCGTLLLRT